MRGQVPLSVAIVLAIIAVIGLAFWTREQTRPVAADGRTELVFWGNPALGEDIYAVIHRFEEANPQYKVVMSAAAARDLTGDAQRLLTAVAGGVPPDVVFFDRFAIGEWASRGALADLSPMLASQRADDPYRIDLAQYYDWSVAEARLSAAGKCADGREARLRRALVGGRSVAFLQRRFAPASWHGRCEGQPAAATDLGRIARRRQSPYPLPLARR